MKKQIFALFLTSTMILGTTTAFALPSNQNNLTKGEYLSNSIKSPLLKSSSSTTNTPYEYGKSYTYSMNLAADLMLSDIYIKEYDLMKEYVDVYEMLIDAYLGTNGRYSKEDMERFKELFEELQNLDANFKIINDNYLLTKDSGLLVEEELKALENCISTLRESRSYLFKTLQSIISQGTYGTPPYISKIEDDKFVNNAYSMIDICYNTYCDYIYSATECLIVNSNYE